MKCTCENFLPKSSSVSSKCLKDMSIFDGISGEDFEILRGIGMRRHFRDGQTLFVQGDPVKEVFIVKGGRIRLSKVLEDGTEITLDFRKPGDLIGEEALSRPIDYPLTAWAMEETVTCGFCLNDFNRLILDNPGFGLKLIGNMSHCPDPGPSGRRIPAGRTTPFFVCTDHPMIYQIS
jgi:CRP-like cAMP-binding protein